MGRRLRALGRRALRIRGRASIIAPLAAASFATSEAAAGTRVRLSVASNIACDDGLESRLAARGVSVSLSAETIANVNVVARESSLEGTLVLVRATGTTSRSVTAASCDEVLDALAFTLALALEGESPEPEPAVPSPRPPSPTAPTSSGVTERSARTNADRPEPSSGLHSSVELAAGVSGGVVRIVAPNAGAAIGGWARVGARRASAFWPSAALGFIFGLPVDSQIAGARAMSAFQAGTLDVCPIRLGPSAFAVRPCAQALFGRSQVRSEGFAGARIDERLLAVVGVTARGEARIAGPVFGHLDLTLGVPLERATYFIGNSRLFETPAMTLGIALGVGVHFR